MSTLRKTSSQSLLTGYAGEAILLESTLMSLKPPPSRVLEAFNHVFHKTNNAGETFPALGGRSARILDDEDD